jgi:hypothetical protein
MENLEKIMIPLLLSKDEFLLDALTAKYFAVSI